MATYFLTVFLSCCLKELKIYAILAFLLKSSINMSPSVLFIIYPTDAILTVPSPYSLSVRETGKGSINKSLFYFNV